MVEQRRLTEIAGRLILNRADKRSQELLERLLARPAYRLEDRADWALGLVTGDNRRYVLDRPAAGTVPVARGRDVRRYQPLSAGSHLLYQPEAFQQVAPRRFYEAPEKLVYRFISPTLVFAYDDTGMFTLNSANIVIPRLPGYTVKATLTFLNSRLFRFVYAHLSPGLKVLKCTLQQLPFPKLRKAEVARLDRLVAARLAGDEAVEAEVEEAVAAAFGLEAAAADHIRRFDAPGL